MARSNSLLASLVERLNRLSIKCARLVCDQSDAVSDLLRLTGKSAAELIELVKAIDPPSITDADQPRELEAIQQIAAIDGLIDLADRLAGEIPVGELAHPTDVPSGASAQTTSDISGPAGLQEDM
jgi:hypothetical protein